MPRYIDADALLESLKNFTYAEPCTEFQRGVNAVVPLILSEIKHFHLADVVQAPEKTCSTCQCNKVCDHNKYGFENCGNYISADVAPRTEVATEIFKEIYKICTHRHGSDGKSMSARIDLNRYRELERKYTKQSAENAETCIACGEIIPESRQVCPQCEKLH